MHRSIIRHVSGRIKWKSIESLIFFFSLFNSFIKWGTEFSSVFSKVLFINWGTDFLLCSTVLLYQLRHWVFFSLFNSPWIPDALDNLTLSKQMKAVIKVCFVSIGIGASDSRQTLRQTFPILRILWIVFQSLIWQLIWAKLCSHHGGICTTQSYKYALSFCTCMV